MSSARPLPRPPAATASRTAPGRGWHRLVVVAASVALAVEGVVGGVVMLRDFGPELGSTLASSQTGVPFWVFVWEGVQLLGAISLPFLALLVLRGSRPGLIAALVLQGAAIAVSGYRVVDTLPDSLGLILFVAVTTVLLSTTSVRDWCLGRSDPAFQRLIADHAVSDDRTTAPPDPSDARPSTGPATGTRRHGSP